MIAAYLADVGVVELAKRFDIHRSTVSAILDRQEVVRYEVGVPVDHVADVVQLYLSGSTAKDIATKLSIDPRTVRELLRKQDVAIRPGGRKKHA
ncbi:MAG: helix-turn-helix domain-containing protein [Acidimicrobiales bacterium]